MANAAKNANKQNDVASVKGQETRSYTIETRSYTRRTTRRNRKSTTIKPTTYSDATTIVPVTHNATTSISTSKPIAANKDSENLSISDPIKLMARIKNHVHQANKSTPKEDICEEKKTPGNANIKNGFKKVVKEGLKTGLKVIKGVGSIIG
uniref:Uncharacterized protein n=1 Tax=Rhabditophanes sp. KR3021 TaxID=114890 RepID=A0AC35TQB7_9BILA